MDYATIILVLIIAILGVWVWHLLKDRRGGGKIPKLVEKQAEEKEKNMRKVMDFLKNNDKIKNNDLERLLGVSNATAERYLDELEKEGILRQVGKIGRDVYYEKNKYY